MAGGLGAGAGARRWSLPEGEGAQGVLRPFLSPLREEAVLSGKGAAFPEQLLLAGQRRLPLQLRCLLPSSQRGEEQERERAAEDAVPTSSLPAAAGAGGVQPGHREVSFSLLRVFRLGRLQNHLQGHPLHSQPSGGHPDPVSMLGWFQGDTSQL